jgi:hypothetical protein
VVRKVVHLRTTRRWGPAQIGARLGLAASTVHRVLVRVGRNRLAWTDRATGLPVRRYEHPAPGCLVHVDVKKLGNIPQGGGHRVHGRQLGKRHSQADKAPVGSHGRRPRHGYGYLHAAVDDHSRLAYVEVHPDEQAATACGFWARAHAWFAERGVTVQRVLTDNGACYRSGAWRRLLQRQGVAHKRTRPYRPCTNGKVERFSRTLLAEWPTPDPTGQNEPAGRPCPPGCIGITITVPTPRSAACHPPAASLISPDRTSSRWSARQGPPRTPLRARRGRGRQAPC